MKKFDAIVIGAGSGLNISSSLASHGNKVAIVEKGPMGGTCLNRGCIPSKIIIHSADLLESINRAADFGINTGKPKIDFARITRRASTIVDKDARMIEKGIRGSENTTLYKTEARFVGERTLQVGKEQIKGDHVFVVAGTREFIPQIDGLEKSGYITSTEALRLAKQPKSLIILGGGFIAAEMAHFYGALGTKVTVIQRSEIMMKKEDHEVAKRFTDLLGKKYNVLTGHQAEKVEKKKGRFIVHVSAKDGRKKTLRGDQLLVAMGRKPNSDILQVDKAGIKTNEKGYITVNDYMETTAKNIWAAGDIVGRYLLKHSANHEAEYALHNALNPSDKKRVDYTAMPHAVFTSPQIAAVGETEEQLKARGADYAVGRYEYKNTGMGEALQEHDGFVKILVDAKTGKILGCHILGSEASILIQEVILAMKYANSIDALVNSIHIHPALSEVVQRAAINIR